MNTEEIITEILYEIMTAIGRNNKDLSNAVETHNNQGTFLYTGREDGLCEAGEILRRVTKKQEKTLKVLKIK